MTQIKRLQAAATILAGMMPAMADFVHADIPGKPTWDEWAEETWRVVLALEAAAPEPSGNPGELRVEPNAQDWQDALATVSNWHEKPAWIYHMEVSREAYRLAAERGKG